MVARPVDLASELIRADLGARGHSRGARREVGAAARADLDHARRGARSVERRGRGALHDLDALDVRCLEVGRRPREGLGQDHAIDDDERRVRATDARWAPELNVGSTAGLSAGDDGDARHLALNRLDRIRRGDGRVLRVHAADGERHPRSTRRIDDAGRDDRLERERCGQQLDVRRRGTAGDADVRQRERAETKPADFERVRAVGHTGDGVPAGFIRRRTQARSRNGDLNSGQRASARRVGDRAGDTTGGGLRKRRSGRERRDEDGEGEPDGCAQCHARKRARRLA